MKKEILINQLHKERLSIKRKNKQMHFFILCSEVLHKEGRILFRESTLLNIITFIRICGLYTARIKRKNILF